METLVIALTALTAFGAAIPKEDIEKQNTAFHELWGTDFQWKFSELPAKGGVEEFRVPYSGYIYPDTAGGTQRVLRKYDQAFNRGRSSATAHEAWDTTAFKEPVPGLFGNGMFGRRLGLTRMRTPEWYGHCNGWTAAAIRHAEPVNNVTRNGVTFTPADIKGLLAEIYIYNQHNVLAGDNQRQVNAGLFHAVVGNWLGRGTHPLGMEADPSEEKWNYPIYAYAASSASRGHNQMEVKMNIAYAKDSNGEYDESPRIKHIKYFHYMLNLNSQGDIIGGYFLRDSSVIDMLWVPLTPMQGGTEGNERGNPYINVNHVLALWRASVPEETRSKWMTVAASDEDRIALVIDGEEIPVATSAEPVTESAEPAMEGPTTESTTSEPDAATETAADAPSSDSEPEAGAPATTEPQSDSADAEPSELTNLEDLFD